MPDETLAGFVKGTAEGLGVTGAAVGVWADGREAFASHGVTSVENPLPVRPGGGRPLREQGHDLHRRDRRGRPGDGPGRAAGQQGLAGLVGRGCWRAGCLPDGNARSSPG